MTSCFVALGANLGFRYETLRGALALLKSHSEIVNLHCSRFYVTAPVSDIPQPSFINAVCRFECILSPESLFSFLEEVEVKLGKRKKPKNAPRKIDLDLIFYGDLLYKTPRITLPHPRWKERAFVIKPLSELL